MVKKTHYRNKPVKLKAKKNKPGAGRPSLFSNEVAEKILELCKNGLTDKQIASIIGVNKRTLEDWRAKNASFMWSVREAKAKADELVERALFQRATGYTHTFQNERVVSNGHQAEVVPYMETIHCPPDVGAIKWWLSSRVKRWSEKPSHLFQSQINVAQINSSQIPSRSDLLTNVGGLLYKEFLRLEEKQAKVGLGSDEIKSMATLTDTLLKITQAKQLEDAQKEKELAEMSTEDLLKITKGLVSEIEGNSDAEN